MNYTCKKTGHKKTAIIKAIDGLLEKKSIKVLDTGTRGVRLFEVNWADPGLVLKSDRSQKETGHKKKPVLVLKRDQSPYRKKTEKENNNSKAKSKQPSSSFSFPESKPKPQVDIDALINLFPENLQQPVLENIVTKGINKHSQEYVQESILYALGNSKQESLLSFKAFLGKTIDNGWGIGYKSDVSGQVKAELEQSRIQAEQAEQEQRVQEQARIQQNMSLLKKLEREKPEQYSLWMQKAAEALGINQASLLSGEGLTLKFHVLKNLRNWM